MKSKNMQYSNLRSFQRFAPLILEMSTLRLWKFWLLGKAQIFRSVSFYNLPVHSINYINSRFITIRKQKPYH
ncbi:UNVERIFIED_CONTAM: hypothetical protein GTU68_012339 [Idotea baltica]|nr:hypothetical protein [Idotea baltica]